MEVALEKIRSKGRANRIWRASITRNFRLGILPRDKAARANRIICGEASMPTTDPRGTAWAISALTLPSPQPTSRTCSWPRKSSRAISSRAQACCTAEFAA